MYRLSRIYRPASRLSTRITTNQLKNYTTTTSTNGPSVTSTLADQGSKAWSFFSRFKRQAGQLFLWMLCGSMALELRWMKSEYMDYRLHMGAKVRKLEEELIGLKRACGEIPPEETVNNNSSSGSYGGSMQQNQEQQQQQQQQPRRIVV